MAAKFFTDEIAKFEGLVICHPVGGDLKYIDGFISFKGYQQWGDVQNVLVSLNRGRIKALKVLVSTLDKMYNEAFQHCEAHKTLNSLEN